ncbi:hypothetical protein [Pseudodesulfovibrio sediminis]|uniref:Uncharacterized protein n=1 Tax=Pseudodesulfovibrio sediminis TaxID=2810563 RepID=A0ABM7P239_9BACT|nr:hypothetical protein [Pseudodesulfovibrio sediminis]BCS86844.1 hypothetical protein PSDVSF_00860 [Pseudodesulfovibrio sediminis]
MPSKTQLLNKLKTVWCLIVSLIIWCWRRLNDKISIVVIGFILTGIIGQQLTNTYNDLAWEREAYLRTELGLFEAKKKLIYEYTDLLSEYKSTYNHLFNEMRTALRAPKKELGKPLTKVAKLNNELGDIRERIRTAGRKFWPFVKATQPKQVVQLLHNSFNRICKAQNDLFINGWNLRVHSADDQQIDSFLEQAGKEKISVDNSIKALSHALMVNLFTNEFQHTKPQISNWSIN